MALDCLPEPCRLCGIAFTHSHTMTPFDEFRKEAFRKHCGNYLYKQFLLFPQSVLLYQRQKLSFMLHLICRLQMLSIWPDPKFCPVGKSRDLNHCVSVTSISSSMFDLVT